MATTLTTGQILPTPQTAIVDPKTGFLSEDGYKFLNNLINQLSQATPTATVETGIEATGLTQATATQLTKEWNLVETAALGGPFGVILDTLQTGQSQVVVNLSGQSINVYPPAGATINALASNAPLVLVTGAGATFAFFSTTQIIKS